MLTLSEITHEAIDANRENATQINCWCAEAAGLTIVEIDDDGDVWHEDTSLLARRRIFDPYHRLDDAGKLTIEGWYIEVLGPIDGVWDVEYIPAFGKYNGVLYVHADTEPAARCIAFLCATVAKREGESK